MAGSSMSGSLIWDSNQCSGFGGTPILPGSNTTRICGLKINDDVARQAVQHCCPSVKTYACWDYCATDQTQQEFSQCIRTRAHSNGSILQTERGAFCLSGTNSTIREEAKSSAAPRAHITTSGAYLLALCLFAFFLSPTLAEIVPSLSKVARRADSSTCQYREDHHYVTLGHTTSFPGSQVGEQNIHISQAIDSGIENNNRTINGTSAAGKEYDDFFDMLSKQVGRQFPAMSSVETQYDFSPPDNIFAIGITPFRWCTNGTATGCQDVLGDASNGTVPVEACGPVFVSDDDSGEPQTAEELDGATIQVVIATIVES